MLDKFSNCASIVGKQNVFLGHLGSSSLYNSIDTK